VLDGKGHVLELQILDFRFQIPEVVTDVASHASALKAHRQSLKNRERNRQYRSRLRNALRDIRSAVDGNNLKAAKDALKQTISLIDKMTTKGIIHRNAAGRYKSRLSSRLTARA
jgi:small subunit ribosomal protein S20